MAKKPVNSRLGREQIGQIENLLPELTALRQEIHRNAELAGSEKNTAKIIINYLKKQKPAESITGIGGNGILAVYKGQNSKSSVCFRAELDALSIPEKNEFNYRSKNPRVAHKCGHDGHMAILCGMGKLLSQSTPFSGDVMLLFQPAEEIGAGAAEMLEDPKFKTFRPDYIFALHNFPGFPLNQVILKSGTLFCASSGMIIKLYGKTCHAAHPEEGLNPAAGMCEIIGALNHLPQTPELKSAFSMVTIIHATLGEIAFGTSPGEAQIMCTLRGSSDETMEELVKLSEDYVNTICLKHGLKYEISWSDKFHATRNDLELVNIIKHAAQSLDFVTTTLDVPFRPSEDFGQFTSRYDGAMFGIGAGENHPALHHDNYDFPDQIIKTGLLINLSILDKILSNQF